MIHKIVLLSFLFLTGCASGDDYLPPLSPKPKIDETNYMKIPCFLDGSIVKKKPKVKNI